MKAVLAGLLALALAGPAWAGRTPSVRAEGQKVAPTGANGTGDIRVPFLNHGNNAFQAYQVAPAIFATPVADDRANPGARPVFNLPFYGARTGFSGSTNGAVPKPTLLPSQAK